jgi:hypothetical protein
MHATEYGRRTRSLTDHFAKSKEQDLASQYPSKEDIVGDVELELLTMNGYLKIETIECC